MRRLVAIIGLTMCAYGCGEKIPLPSNIRDDDGGKLTDTTFVAILPHWTSADGIAFDYPAGVAVGYDRTIYICDTRNDRIVRLQPDGEFIESFEIPHPYGVAQDRSFALAATLGRNVVWLRRNEPEAVFAPYVEAESTYYCKPQPHGPVICWWEVSRFEAISATRDATGIFVTVGGGRVMQFFSDWYQPFPDLDSVIDSSSSYGNVYNPTGVAFGVIGDRRRLIVAQYPGLYGVQYLEPPTYEPAFPDEGQDIFHMPYSDTKYVAMDDQGNVFVLHRAHGVVMMFDKDGRHVLSFGRDGTDELSLHHPTCIAVFDDIVLIADAKNNRIARYQLTSIPQN